MTESQKIFFSLLDEGKFSITPDGVVMRHHDARLKDPWLKTPRPATTTPDGNGYFVTNYKVNGVQFGVQNHIAAWLFYNGEIPDGLEVNHKNGVKTDNRMCNLELVTRKEQMEHASATGLIPRGERHYAAKLTEAEVFVIICCRGLLTQQKLAEIFGVCQPQISDIQTGKRWPHVYAAWLAAGMECTQTALAAA